MAMSDTRWSVIHAAQRGDRAALERLCAKYRPAVVSYLSRRGLGADAEDVAQQTLVSLVDVLPKAHASAGSFRALVFAVARHERLSFLEHASAVKRGGRAVRVPLEASELAAAEPDEDFDREWLGALIRTCLERLEREQPTLYQALASTVLIERPQKDAAQAAGISPAAMRKRVWRARKQIGAILREQVEAYGVGREDVREELRYLSQLLGPLRVDEDEEAEG